MPSWYPQSGDFPTAYDTEVQSLQKCVSILYKWAQATNADVSIPWYPEGAASSPHDTEVMSLQKMNAILLGISKT